MHEKDKVVRIKKNTSDNILDIETFEPEWIDLGNITPKIQTWLWPNIIPFETCTLFAGSGGIGKSALLIYLSAQISKGGSFNCCGEIISFPKGSVIMLAAEDREDTHLLPNLLASNAIISNIYIIKSMVGVISKRNKFLNLDKQLYVLEEKLKELFITDNPVKLITIDPVGYFIGDIKGHIEPEVANFIQSLNDLARKYNTAIILNKHLRKKSGKQAVSSVIDDVGGSAAWVNTPRQSFAFMRHPTDDKKILMFNLKVNIAAKTKEALCYTIKQVDIVHNGIYLKPTTIEWCDKKELIDIESAVNKETFNKSKSELAQELIYNYLKSNGVTSIDTLKSVCNKYEISDRTCQRSYLDMEKNKTIKRVKGNIKPSFELCDGWDGTQ